MISSISFVVIQVCCSDIGRGSYGETRPVFDGVPGLETAYLQDVR